MRWLMSGALKACCTETSYIKGSAKWKCIQTAALDQSHSKMLLRGQLNATSRFTCIETVSQLQLGL